MHTIGVKLEMLTSSYAHNRKMKERKISQASLENLKLGAIARRKDKVRVNLSLLPTTIKWLKKHDAKGEMSNCVDEIVRRIIAGELVRASIDKPS